MARIFIEGFESGTVDLWEEKYGTPSIQSTTKKSGTYAFSSNNSATIYMMKNISTVSTLYFKFWMYVTNPSSIGIIFATIESGTTYQNCVCINTSRYLEVRRGNSSGTLLGTSVNQLPQNTWCLLEGKIVVADSGGEIEIKLNGLDDLIIDYTGDTQGGTTADITKVLLGCNCASSGWGSWLIDDFVLDDADWIGNTRIQPCLISGAGSWASWTPSTGSNYACVDEVPASDTDYNSINSIDKIDSFATNDLTGSIALIECVQIQARVWKEGSPTPLNLALTVRVGGVDYVGSDNAVSTNAKSFFELYQSKPGGGSWATADVNGMEIGYKSKT